MNLLPAKLGYLFMIGIGVLQGIESGFEEFHGWIDRRKCLTISPLFVDPVLNVWRDSLHLSYSTFKYATMYGFLSATLPVSGPILYYFSKETTY
jgi:hypothetical protein